MNMGLKFQIVGRAIKRQFRSGKLFVGHSPGQVNAQGANVQAGAAQRTTERGHVSKTRLSGTTVFTHPHVMLAGQQPQPATGEVLPTPMFIPCESRDAVDNAANPNTPHGKTRAIPSRRV